MVKPSGSSSTTGQQAPTPDLISQADLIVVGRIAGLADSGPGAEGRRQFEVHWIDVEETIKGPDHTGQRLGARPPEGLFWADGAAYVMFLRSAPGNIVSALPQPLIEASDEQVAAVRRLANEQGAGMTERRVLWMSQTGGQAPGVISELHVTASGRFEWRKLRNPERPEEQVYETVAGTAPSEAVSELRSRILELSPGPPADDAVTVMFGWLTDDTVRNGKICTASDPACSALLQAVEALARQHGGLPGEASGS